MNIEAAVKILIKATEEIAQAQAETKELLSGGSPCYPGAAGTQSAGLFLASVNVIHALRHLDTRIEYPS